MVINAAMNTGVQTPLQDFAFNSLGNMSRSRIVGPYGTSIFFFFEETPYFSPKQLYHFAFPKTEYQASNFSTFLATRFVFCFIFRNSNPDGREVTSHCCFDLYFSNE